MRALGEQLVVLAGGRAEPAAASEAVCVIKLLGDESRLAARPACTLALPPTAGAAPVTLRQMLPEALAALVPAFPQRADAAGRVMHPALDVAVASPLWLARSLMEQMRCLPPQCRKGLLRPLAIAAGLAVPPQPVPQPPKLLLEDAEAPSTPTRESGRTRGRSPGAEPDDGMTRQQTRQRRALPVHPPGAARNRGFPLLF